MTSSGAKQLLSWYASTRSLTVDIVGDFAGHELFIIHGESLILHCLNESKVDFERGFQLLHAVYTIENFLANLRKRGCNFDVVFFKNLSDTCAPSGIDKGHDYKYLLTRTIIIEHLKQAENSNDVRVFEFPDFEHGEFEKYLSTYAVHFVLCHEGDGADGSRVVSLRSMIRCFISRGINVAVVNHIAWKSSKVFVPMITATHGSLQSIAISYTEPSCLTSKSIAFPKNLDFLVSRASLRTQLVCFVCWSMLHDAASKDEEPNQELIQTLHCMLLHLAVLEVQSLQGRAALCREALQGEEVPPLFSDFLRVFCQTAHQIIIGDSFVTSRASTELWNLYDFVDGLIFFAISHRLDKGDLKPESKPESIPESVISRAQYLWDCVASSHSKAREKFQIKIPQTPIQVQSSCEPSRTIDPSILTFDHPILNKYLEGVRIQEVDETTNPAAEVVFEDLNHWHVNKPVVSWKKPEQKDFKKRRSNQRLMADVIAYAASLTNSRGKILDRETIVAKSQGNNERPDGSSKKATGNKASRKGVSKKGGRANAERAVLEVQERKALVKRDDLVNFWSKHCKELERDPSLVARYLKADKFLSSRTSDDFKILEPEVKIYACHILSSIWAHQLRHEASSKGEYIAAMTWRSLRDVVESKRCSPDIAAAVNHITTSLQLPSLPVDTGSPARALPFRIDFERQGHGSSPLARDNGQVLQLEYGGPYLDRHFDSQSDPRVPFEPDAWQRKVLDSIDADESLLVVAPTSAGKTFISFYAMKKVLEESDDGVLVYVAPTKALVNQIAAEIEARFSKTYHGKAGKSVWAVHTRDYRINNPAGCQILVTVPQILQIMLLSPANANHSRAWSCRVKRIIFDEVHCIGQSEDGVIWEQLLLLAPCPIIALSATVGNPDEFRNWLELSQAQKHNKMTMIVHGVRYSDLRKFIYKPCSEFVFKGLQKVERLPVPGLDEGEAPCQNFEFVHPIVALKDRNRGVLDDISLEARDCYTLWKEMAKVKTLQVLKAEIKALNPKNALPGDISKSDVVEWERDLKKALRKTMEDNDSTFHRLQDSLKHESSGAHDKSKRRPPRLEHTETLFQLACDLHQQDALPAIVFNYDRLECEIAVRNILTKLVDDENDFKFFDPSWSKKVTDFREWKKGKMGQKDKNKRAQKGKNNEDQASKLEQARDQADKDISPWESFDPKAPLEQFSFADWTKMQRTEFFLMVKTLNHFKVAGWLITALERGLGIHHAGMNRRYRQVVEMLFRRGYLRLVVATGTLALGINMPCKTVVFSGDSIFLTAQNYRQAAGRAGRRGFDLLGNVVFNGISRERVYEIMSSRLPDLRGQFPISTSLVLRLMGLLHGTNNSSFAVDAVQALLSQTRLYLGGPDAEMSVKHHLRFSIEYLRRQNLLSAKGEPLNFAGLVGHLYFTENAVFAFHSLLRGGYFHELCASIDIEEKQVLHQMMLVLCHLFNRIPLRANLTKEQVHRSSSVVFLPRLPKKAEEMLIQHNNETLAIFKGYVQSYINQYLADKPDHTLPFTETVVKPEKQDENSKPPGPYTDIRSPFMALSGFTDDFGSIHELCSGVRGGVFLEESAIPFIPIWPHDIDVGFNAYIYDFFKHGSMEVLVRDNWIKKSEVWFLLKDFSLTLQTIVTSLEGLVSGETELPDFEEDEDYGDDTVSEADDEVKSVSSTSDEAAELAAFEAEKRRLKAKKKEKKVRRVVDSWEDEMSSGSSSESSDNEADEAGGRDRPAGLMNVLKAFKKLQESFDELFKKEWA